jgi:hypothetical protein
MRIREQTTCLLKGQIVMAGKKDIFGVLLSLGKVTGSMIGKDSAGKYAWHTRR